MSWKNWAVLGACLAVPAVASAQHGLQSLSKVELLALQQEMRDRGCGNRHAPGVITAETRRAVRTCMQRTNTSNARELLASFNIGFGAGDHPPTVMDTDPNTPGVQHDSTPGMRRGREGTQPGRARPAPRGGGQAEPRRGGVDRPRGTDFGTFESDTAPGSVRRRMEGARPGTPEQIRGTPSPRARPRSDTTPPRPRP